VAVGACKEARGMKALPALPKRIDHRLELLARHQ